MTRPLVLSPDRLFPAEPSVRGIARRLYSLTRNLPIVSPHGHPDPAWFATDAASNGESPDARPRAYAAMTVSPAPVTSTG